MKSIVCFSYLAAVKTLNVDHFPPLDYGVEIERSSNSVAGDGPLVAAGFAANGWIASLTCNDPGSDSSGASLREQVRRWGVSLRTGSELMTCPQNFVVCDRLGNRTWFSGLGEAVATLPDLALPAPSAVDFVYIDCYEVIGMASVAAAIAALDATAAQVCINLGGSPPSAELVDALRTRRRPQVLQTSSASQDRSEALDLAHQLAPKLGASHTVVTAGAGGVVAISAVEVVESAAFEIEDPSTPGAGAAFSVGFLLGLDSGSGLSECCDIAQVFSANWCSSRTPRFTVLADVPDFQARTRRSTS